jgi:peptidoglycan/LPS O-acetylase OafA/YrhL
MAKHHAAPTRLPHLPRLDGLRGVAIALVVIFHTGLGALPGGYLGIDLFFVLSGYLITTLLVTEYSRRHRIDLKNFWIRRIRRLFPALLVVLAAIALFVLVTNDQSVTSNLRWDGLSTLFYVANWRFIASGQSYFASFSPSPLRHTWSLAVEEQWYLIWPPVLWGLLRLVKGQHRKLVLPICLLAVASAVTMGLLAAGDISRAYYGTDARAQALLIGAALSLAMFGRSLPGGRRLAQFRTVGMIGFLGLVVLSFTAPDQAPWMYRGGFLLAACFGAMVVVTAVWVTDGPVAYLLNARWLRYLGTISYGVYLWHWPIDVLLNSNRMGFGGWPLAIVQTTIAVLIAAASSRWIEIPIREGRPRVRAAWKAAASGLSLASVTALFAVVTVGAAAVPLPQATTGRTVSATPAKVGDVKVLVVGDSVAWALTRRPPTDLGLHVDSSWHIQCDLIGDEMYVSDQLNEAGADCSKWPQEWASAASRKPDVIVVVLGLRQLFDPQIDGTRLPVGSAAWKLAYRKAVQHSIDVLRAESSVPIVFFDVPCYTWSTTNGDDAASDPTRLRTVNTELRRVVDRNEGVHVVDYASQVCTGPRGTENIVSKRPDGAHPTLATSQAIWEWLAPKLRSAVAEDRAPTPTRAGG